VEVGGIEPPS